MATKTITLLGTQATCTTKGQAQALTPYKGDRVMIFTSGVDDPRSAWMEIQAADLGAGHWTAKVYDKNNALVGEDSGSISNGLPYIELGISDAAAGVTTSLNNGGLSVRVNLDAATFATGKIVFEMMGSIGQLSFIGRVETVGKEALSWLIGGNGVATCTLPFTVVEA